MKKNPTPPAATPSPKASTTAGAAAAPRAAKKSTVKAAAAPVVPVPDKKAPEQAPRLVRDSFTMPANDFALIAELKARALAGRRAAKKSELLRAGLRALRALAPKALVQALNGLEPVKVGRPKKRH